MSFSLFARSAAIAAILSSALCSQSLIDLQEQARSHNWQKRRGAVEALALHGALGVPTIEAALSDRHSSVRRRAAEVLGPLMDDAHSAADSLVESLRDPVREVREAAARALGWMRVRKTFVVEALTTALRDRWSWTRSAAAISLGELRVAPRLAVPALVGAFADENPFVRDYARRSLGWILRDDNSQLSALNSALESNDWRQRLLACEVLQAVGPSAVAAVESLRARKRDSYYKVRRAARAALAAIQEHD